MNSIRLSVLDLSPIYEESDAFTALQQSVLLAQTAERLGYTRYWVTEHHDMPQLASSCPEVLLAHVGAKTERIRIGSGAVLLPYYKPYKVATAFTLLAALYPGRIDLGIGRAPGGSAHVSMALSDNYLQQVSKMPQLVKELTAILANRYTVEGERVVARPVAAIPPELWLLGTNSKSAAYAAENGAGYVFGHFMSEQDGREILAAYNRDFQPSWLQTEPRGMLAVSVICAETSQEAARLAGGGEAVMPGRKSIVGDPYEVSQSLQKMAKEYRVSEFIVVTSIPDYEKRLRSYELLAKSVLGTGNHM